jgi:copper chaperone CopZ
MKKIIAIAVLLFSAFVSNAQIKSAALTASGLTCSMCSKSIYKSLMKMPSVQDVQVDIENSIFNIAFKPGSKVSPDDVKKAVSDAGFAVASLKMTADFSATQVENDAHVDFAGKDALRRTNLYRGRQELCIGD